MATVSEGKAAKRLAWALGALAVLSCIAGVILILVTRNESVVLTYGFRGAVSLICIPFAVMGALLAARRRRNPIGWLFLAVGVGTGIGTFGEGYATYSFTRHGASLPLTDPLAWFQQWNWVILVPCALIYPFLLFPEGHLPSRRWRWVARLTPLAVVGFAAGIATPPGQLQTVAAGYMNPYSLSKDAADTLTSVFGAPFMAPVIIAVVSLSRRFRRTTGDEHEQMKWLLLAGGVTAAALVGNLVAYPFTASNGKGFPTILAIVTQVAVGGIAVGAGVGVLKYRLYDIDVFISKTVLFGALALGIGSLYVAVVVGVGAAVGTRGESNVGLSVAATALVALAFSPLRSWAQRVANRFVYGRRATPHEVLNVLSERIADSYSLDEVLPRVARLVTEATAASRAEVWVRVGADLRPAGAWPHDIDGGATVPLSGDDVPAIPGAPHVYPVRHQGELLGVLAASAPANDQLGAADERMLSDLASHAGLVMRNVRLIEELRASRQRLVTVQDAERRRIERNLHDGAQQHLVALSVNLRLARTLLDADGNSAKELLEQLQSEAGEALENLRDLARGIYPPLLADKGLAEALTGQAHKAPLPVTVEVGTVGRYPIEVESAIYFCVLEALQNVGKYSGASGARILLDTDNGRLTFAVSDDGAGFDMARVARGAGLTNMTDRIEALGGRLEIESRPGSGTTVRGWVATSLGSG
jgi:signal transduction histidine kinase